MDGDPPTTCRIHVDRGIQLLVQPSGTLQQIVARFGQPGIGDVATADHTQTKVTGRGNVARAVTAELVGRALDLQHRPDYDGRALDLQSTVAGAGLRERDRLVLTWKADKHVY